MKTTFKSKYVFTTALAVLVLSLTAWHFSQQQEQSLVHRMLQTYATSSTRLSLNNQMCAGLSRNSFSLSAGKSQA